MWKKVFCAVQACGDAAGIFYGAAALAALRLAQRIAKESGEDMGAGRLVSQFSTEAGLGSAAIRYLSDSSVSHVDLVIEEDRNLGGVTLKKGWLLGARLHGGVQQRPPEYAKFTRTVRMAVEVPDVDAAYAFAARQIGKPYNKRAIVNFFLHRKRAFTPEQPAWFCDELNYQIVAAGGLLLLGTENPLNLTPQEELLSPYWKKVQA